MTSTSQKERAQKVIPGGTWKKDSSAKSLNDINKSKRKSANSYPRRHEKKGELRKVSKWHQQVTKKEREKLSLEARQKKESFAKSHRKVQKKKYMGFSQSFSEKCAEHVSRQVSECMFMQNWHLFGLRGDFPYCKRFMFAGTKREPSKQSLWEKE